MLKGTLGHMSVTETKTFSSAEREINQMCPQQIAISRFYLTKQVNIFSLFSVSSFQLTLSSADRLPW